MAARLQVRQRLDVVDAELAAHAFEIQRLKRERFSLVTKLRRGVCFVLTLPTEVTALIFTCCLSAYEPGLNLTRTAPLNLARVCRQWRDVAVGTPALWNTTPPMPVDHLTPAAIDCWASRSGNRALNLTLVRGDGFREIGILRRHAAQIGRLHILTQKPYLKLAPLTVFPQLSYLTLAYVNIPDPAWTFELDRAPALRHLSLRRIRAQCLPNFHWAQLTTLALKDIGVSDVLDILRLAITLRELQVETMQYSWASASDNPITHSSLVSLDIVTACQDEPLLQYLNLNSLRQFRLGRYRGNGTAGHLTLITACWLERVSGSLENWTVCLGSYIPTEHLQPLSKLTSLELVRSILGPYDRDVIHTLNRRSYPEILPQLQSLVLAECWADDANPTLFEALESRCVGGDPTHATLRSFAFIWEQCHPWSSASVDLDPLWALAAHGLSVHVGTRPESNL